MNNEKMNQMIDEAYENYLKGGDIKWLKQEEVDTPIGKMNMPIPYTKEEFINKCKTDTEFSERWGLKIEERELSFEEREKLYVKRCLASGDGLSGSAGPNNGINYEFYEKLFVKYNVPTKLITITYNGTKIESYEN